MRIVLVTIMLMFITSCAGKAVFQNPDELSFVKVSQGKARGFYSWVTGDAKYCMVEFFNIEGITISAASYKDGSCTVTWHRTNRLPDKELEPEVQPGT